MPVLTLVLLLLLDISLRQGNPVDALNVRSVDAWDAVSRIKLCRRVVPQVALLGSSLILVLNQDPAGQHFLTGYDPTDFRQRLDQATGTNINVINVATGAQMVSEAYYAAEALCNARRHPSVIIYGITIRDFLHEQMAKEWRTESFASIAPFVPLSALPNVSPAALKEFLLCHFLFIYRDRLDFKSLFSAWSKLLLEKTPINFPFFRLGTDCVWRPTRDGYLLEYWIPRTQEPYLEKMRLEHPDRLIAYFRDLEAFSCQMKSLETAKLSQHYFNCLQDLCQRKNIQLVVINMPLSPVISAVVPDEGMQVFRHYLQTGEEMGKYKYIDLWKDSRFTDSDFKDGGHFNPSGVKKFDQILVNLLRTKYPDIVQRMVSQAGGH